MSVLRITPVEGPTLRIAPTIGPALSITPSGGPVMNLTPLYQTGNALRGLSGFCGGRPLEKPGGEIVAGGEAPYDYVVGPDGLSAKAKVDATAETVFTVYKDDALLGYLTFAAGSKIAIPTVISGSVIEGQYVSVRAPTVPDLTLADITFLVMEG